MPDRHGWGGKKTQEAEGNFCAGEAARKHQGKLGGPEFGPWLAQASILNVDDEPNMLNFLVRTLGPLRKRIEEASDTEQASRKLDADYFVCITFARRTWGGAGEPRNQTPRSKIPWSCSGIIACREFATSAACPER